MFLTLQRGNAVHDALRRNRTRSVQTGMPTRSMGTIDVLWRPMIIVSALHLTAPEWARLAWGRCFLQVLRPVVQSFLP
ncbi:DUF1534 domain-containing protein [Pseudomonas congelans]|nr:DUF1534 domain-containing protein [Pseudomonas congelans]